jgi:hypothetical protein
VKPQKKLPFEVHQAGIRIGLSPGCEHNGGLLFFAVPGAMNRLMDKEQLAVSPSSFYHGIGGRSDVMQECAFCSHMFHLWPAAGIAIPGPANK